MIDLGVDPGRVALSHTDKVDDPGYHRELLATGVNLVYDQCLRRPAATIGLLVAMLAAGHAGRLMLGTDGARRSMWSSLGGHPGLASLLTDFVPSLRGNGVEPGHDHGRCSSTTRRGGWRMDVPSGPGVLRTTA